MALTKTTNFFGIEIQDVYVRVASFKGNKQNLVFEVQYFTDSQELQAFKTEANSCQLLLDDSNPIKQAYLHLKTLPEFADAVDC
jgi:hypothetical protein